MSYASTRWRDAKRTPNGSAAGLDRTRTIDGNTWLFPGGRAGHHVTQSYLMTEIRRTGINALAAKNRTLDDLVTEMPAALVADTLGYSYQVAELHKANAGGTYARYAALRRD